MLILGLDISSNSTGWGLIEDNKLLHYGLVKPEGSMETIQRLYFFGNEIKKVIDKYQPDEIAIEEIILVHGPKTMRVLARFSGVALFQAYAYQKRDVKTYEPQVWKKMLGVSGSALKPEVQLFICKKFDLLEQDKIKEYLLKLEGLEFNKKEIRFGKKKDLRKQEKEIKIFEKEIKIFERNFKKKKKKEKTEDEFKKIEENNSELKMRKENYKIRKKGIDREIKEINKEIDQISLDIYSDTGVNSDVADSCGIALTLFKSLNEDKTSK